MLIVDSREFRSGVVKELFNQGVIYQSVKLLYGDYLINENIIIERKGVKDFVDSLIDKRIFSQIINLKNEFKKVIIIVEGGENIYSVRNVHPNAIMGLISSILVDFEIPIFFSRDEKDSANFIRLLSDKYDKIDESYNINKTRVKDYNSMLESVVNSLEGVGIKTSKLLLDRFKTLNNLFNASIDELMSVDGVGKKVAEKIYKISNKEYKIN